MTKIIQRHDTAANWTSVNPTLSQGELGVETDTGKFKIGDGQTVWTSLPYASSGEAGGSGLEICDIGMALYVDETKGLRRYLNGQIVDINTNTQAFLDRLKEITTLHPSLLCTEEEWQTAKTMSAFGQVGKFVFNYSGENIVSVRLPRVVNVQGLFDLQNLGMTVSESLPNIKSGAGLSILGGNGGQTGAIVPDSRQWGLQGGTNPYEFIGHIDASAYNKTYQDNAPVQQEAIQYPYFIQIATGSETEAKITNKFENTNPQTLLESKYSDKPLYNESWLLSNGQYNLKATYPTAYEGLQVEYNTEIEAGTTVTLPSGVSYTKRGLSVKLSTEEYTDYDFVLNTADETFRVPLKTKLASGKAVVGNGMTIGLTNGFTNDGLTVTNSNSDLFASPTTYGLPIGHNSSSLATSFSGSDSIGLTTDGAKSGIETSDSGLYLYFYVGDIDQNHGIVNMGRIGEQLADKIGRQECKAYITETYQNGSSWYRVWSDGWIEQGGSLTIKAHTTATVTLIKPFSNTNYTLQYTQGGWNDSFTRSDTGITAITKTSFTIGSTAGCSSLGCWYACGY